MRDGLRQLGGSEPPGGARRDGSEHRQPARDGRRLRFLATRRTTAPCAAGASPAPPSSRSSIRSRSRAGMSPVSTITGIKQVAVSAPEGVWIPRDERASEQDTLTLREALLESSNAAAGAPAAAGRLASRAATWRHDLGVTNQPDVPSLALGSGLVTPLDLTAALRSLSDARLSRASARASSTSRTPTATACIEPTSRASRSSRRRSRSRC